VSEESTVFISYSHRDERWKSDLVQQLGVLETEGLIQLWDDRRIAVGTSWQPEIEAAIARARVAVLLVSASFLTSPFIRGEEVPRLLQRRATEGLHLFPVLVRPCDWEAVDWLRQIQMRPRDARALSGMNVFRRETEMATLASELRALLAAPGEAPATTSAPPAGTEVKAAPQDTPRAAIPHRVLTLGARPEKDGTSFRVWAPDRARVEVLVLDDAGGTRLEHELNATDGGYFAAFVRGVGPGDRYRYRLDGGASYPDPASRSQPEGVHGPSAVVDPDAFGWTDHEWTGVGLDGLVLYQVHVGTATPDGTFAGLVGELEHVRGLGATAIVLMPVAEFPGDRNWGYDGVNLFAPSRAYGGPDGLRALVDAAHARDLAVILDVAFNHVGPGHDLKQFSESYFSDHQTPWGEGLNYSGRSGRPVRDFLVTNACHWALEYHIDGLRFDAVHAIKEADEPHILMEARTALDEVLPGERPFLLIAEHELNDPRLVKPIGERGFGLDAVYADDFHHQVYVAVTSATLPPTGYYADYSGTAEDLVATLKQGWWFTGQHSTWRGRRVGEPAADVSPPHFVFCLENHDQVGNRPFGERLSHLVDLRTYRALSTLLLTLPYTPLLFMGQEWAASTPFLYFTDHEPGIGQDVTAGRMEEVERLFPGYDRERAPKPQHPATFERSRLVADERREPPHDRVLALYRDLLDLRVELPGLRIATRDHFTAVALGPATIATRREGQTPADALLTIVHWGEQAEVPLAGDFATSPPVGERWAIRLDTEESRYGGSGGIDLTDDAVVRLDGPGACLLTQVAAG
jgi:maltooligosyltrehalose trehalohydrolase